MMSSVSSVFAHIKASHLPDSWQNEIVKSESGHAVVRSNLKSMDDITGWVMEFGKKTQTSWNVRSSRQSCQRIICSKKFICQHSSYRKIDPQYSNRKSSKNSHCCAKIYVKVKISTGATRFTDPFVKKGLCGVIVINNHHTHTLGTGATLHFLHPSPAEDVSVKEKFVDYFDSGMGVAEACHHHAKVLEHQEMCAEADLVSEKIIPTKECVLNWHDEWKLKNMGKRCQAVLIQRLKEKQQIYEEEESLTRIVKLLKECEQTYGPSSLSGLKKVRQRLEAVHSVAQWENFIHCMGGNIPVRREVVAIHVQPASLTK